MLGTPQLYTLAADWVAILHAGYVVFVVGGLLAILVGGWRDWRWTRNRWFRRLHLLAIAVVVAESLLGIWCPLTVWEMQLRELGGESTDARGFLAYWIHRLMFYDWPASVFTALYVIFGALVAAVYWWYPPQGRVHEPAGARRRHRRSAGSS